MTDKNAVGHHHIEVIAADQWQPTSPMSATRIFSEAVTPIDTKSDGLQHRSTNLRKRNFFYRI